MGMLCVMFWKKIHTLGETIMLCMKSASTKCQSDNASMYHG